MLFPVEPIGNWCEKYSISLEKGRCLHCAKEISFDTPVATKKFRGVRSEEHGCPPEYFQYILVPATKDKSEKILNSRAN